jgi:HPt (histidine-containing phosphotransfer) domain-containing protein
MTTPPSGSPLGMADFFALEAGEYLERLDGLLGPEGPPAADEFVRLARALRGSALMASQTPIARAAAGLESLARGVREGRRGWEPGTRQVAIRAVDDLKILVRRVAAWDDNDTERAEALARELEQLSGRPSGVLRQAEALGLDAGARAFVAREGAAIGSALDRTATALRAGTPARDALQHVLRALQPLRGLAALNDLQPLPDVLEGIERAVTEVTRGGAPPAAAPDFFQSAAGAITQAAREVAERGRPEPEGPAFRAFAAQMARFFDREPAVIPISELYFDDTGPHILQRGAETAQALPLSRLELVSHGEHLRLAADAIERAPSPTQRELRVHTLAGTFRALAVAGEGPLPQMLSRFADAAREVVALGYAVRDPAAFAEALRHASGVLTTASTSDDATLAAGLQQTVAQLGALSRAPEPPAPPPAPEVAEAPESTFATFLREVTDAVEAPAPAPEVVPIESLAPAPEPEPPPPPPPPPQPVAAPTPEPPRVKVVWPRRPAMPPLTLKERSEVPAETPDIVGSWITYQRMVASGVGPPSLDVLMGHVPEVVSGVDELPIVDIKTLQYGGASALARVQELRAVARRTPQADLPALFEEVCDLVDLAFEPGA